MPRMNVANSASPLIFEGVIFKKESLDIITNKKVDVIDKKIIF